MTSPVSPGEAAPATPRIAICGLSLEASTYSPARTTRADFVRQHGAEILDYYPFFDAELRARATWLPLVRYRAIPGGAIPRADYDAIKREMVDALAAVLPVDGVLFDIHGAASVVGLDDPEADLAAALRAVAGERAVFSSGMDLHGNVSLDLAQLVDLMTCYRMAPHEDWLDTKARAAVNLVEWLARHGEKRPARAWVQVPILLPGEQTSTRLEPAAGLYAKVGSLASGPGHPLWDLGLWVGYPWADEPRNQAAIVAYGEDAEACGAACADLAQGLWEAREQFTFVAPTGTLDECLDLARDSTARPYFVSDSGDNPTAGGAGDVTWSLARLLERTDLEGLRVVYASIPDAPAARLARDAGVGATVTLTLGARVDPGPEGPLSLTGVVEHIAEGDEVAQTEVVLRIGPVAVLLTERRKPYHLISDFTRNGIDVSACDIVLVKIGYLEPELFAAAADWRLALTPGGVDQHLARLGHERVARPMFPLDAAARAGGGYEPTLTPTLLTEAS
ncbi:M81 family metallopeptidase [Micrococcales bacterium 31B]|nr:M81 family metallopeptidase [Micrococcales bacterium 31B]